MEKDLEVMVCPEGHYIPFTRESYAKDFSGGHVDCDGVPMYEEGLYCYVCSMAYGLSKLSKPSEEVENNINP